MVMLVVTVSSSSSTCVTEAEEDGPRCSQSSRPGVSCCLAPAQDGSERRQVLLSSTHTNPNRDPGLSEVYATDRPRIYASFEFHSMLDNGEHCCESCNGTITAP